MIGFIQYSPQSHNDNSLFARAWLPVLTVAQHGLLCCRTYLPEAEDVHGAAVLVVVVPATRKILAHHSWQVVGAENAIHLVLLAPHKGLAEHLTSLFQIEVLSLKESHQHLVTWNLGCNNTTK